MLPSYVRRLLPVLIALVWCSSAALAADSSEVDPRLATDSYGAKTDEQLAAEAKTKLPAAVSMPSAEYLRHLHDVLEHPQGPQDIDPQLFQDFWLKWELVTTRYKRDGNQLRFIYANKIAAAALAKGRYPLPDGSVVAKIGADAVHDPLFDSSLIPGEIRQVQIMLRKPDDPHARKGWVYSIYVPGRDQHNLSDAEINACHVCHLIAKSRDLIFAQPFPIVFGAAPAKEKDSNPFSAGYRDTRVSRLSGKLQKIVADWAPGTKRVRLLKMPVFAGALFEASEIIARATREDGKVHLVSSLEEDSVMIATVDRDKPTCVTTRIYGKFPTNYFKDDVPPEVRRMPELNAGAGGIPPVTQHNCAD